MLKGVVVYHQSTWRQKIYFESNYKKKQVKQVYGWLIRLTAYMGWNGKIVVLKKQHYSFILKLLLRKSIQVTWLCSRAEIYSM